MPARDTGAEPSSRYCESKVPPTGVRAGGRPKSGWPACWSSSLLAGSTTGSVRVSNRTGIAATRPSILSQIFLSRQLVSVGNNVDRNTCGAGKMEEGHHLGVRATS